MRPEIERVVEGIRERYHEDLSLDSLAEMARLSPYHMARIFHQETGLPPARFLGAVRLEEAKRKLVFTSDSIADISLQVGYSSLGTFTTRFTERVGLPPGRYRRLQNLQATVLTCPASSYQPAPFSYGAIGGWTHRTDGPFHAPVFIAAFPAKVDSNDPERGRLEKCSGPWRIDCVPEGHWIVRAVSLNGSCDLAAMANEEWLPILVGQAGPVHVRAGETVEVDVILRPPPAMRNSNAVCNSLAFTLPKLFPEYSTVDAPGVWTASSARGPAKRGRRLARHRTPAAIGDL